MRKHALRISALLVSAALAQQAFASGYHFGTQSGSDQGTANASGAAAADASTIFDNPAGLSHVAGDTFSGVLDVVIPSGSFTDQGSHSVLGTPTGGDNGGSFLKTTVVPHFYLSHQVSDQLTVGFGAFVPFGSNVQYDSNWVGRYDIIQTDLATMALNPSFAFRVNPHWTFGGGLTAQYIYGKLVKGADFGTAALTTPIGGQTILGGAPAALQPALIGQFAANPTYDGQVSVKGDDWGYGFNFGTLIDIDEHTRVGVAYRSTIHHKLAGTATWTVPQTFATNATLNGLGGYGTLIQGALNSQFTNSSAQISVVTPDSTKFNIYHDFTDRLALMADVTYTKHSYFKQLNIQFQNTLPPANIPENWANTTSYSVGGTYRLSDMIKLRAGYMYDQSPVTDSNRTPALPDGNRRWYSLGMNLALNKTNSFDFAYSYIQVGNVQLSDYDNGGVSNSPATNNCSAAENTSSCSTTLGREKLSSSIVSVQYNHTF